MGSRELLRQPNRMLGVACNGMPIASRSGSNTLWVSSCFGIVC